MGELRHDAGDERYTQDVKLVRKAMMRDRGHARVAKDGFVGARSRRAPSKAARASVPRSVRKDQSSAGGEQTPA